MFDCLPFISIYLFAFVSTFSGVRLKIEMIHDGGLQNVF